MKFVISKQELNNLISKLQNVVGQKTTIPILSNFLIEAVNDELVLTATDLTVGIRCFTDAKILEEGATTLPTKKFSQLVRELTCANLEIHSNSNEVTEIVANSSRFKLNGMNKDEYPTLPDTSGAIVFRIDQELLKDMFFRTAFAVSREDNRYVLTGVYMHISQGTATFVGTDGKRLSKAKVSIEIDPSFSGSYIIPLKAVEEITKNLESGTATVYLLQDKIAVDASNTMIITKLLTGEYPDVNRVIPESTETVVRLHREELMSLLRQISLFIEDTSHSVRFTFSNGELRLTANSMEIGEGKVMMPVDYHGDKLEIAFNPTFFLDILRHCKEEIVSLGITDAYNPGVLTDNDTPPNASANLLFVIMPMRLNED